MHMGGVWRTGGTHYYFLGAVKIPEESDEDISLDQVVQNCKDTTSISKQLHHVTRQAEHI
jgi:hypothetical protein